MENKKEVDYTENTLFQNFPQETFSSKTALWVRAFCYGFGAVHLFSIILEQIQRYCITPPGMFLQIIFFVIMGVIIEFICIQTTNISDHLTLDYAKDIVSLTKHRFFLFKVSILASFDQIRMVGVSCGPTNRIKHIFTSPAKRYAVVFMNYRNQIVKITDFNMDLDEANNFGLELAEKHMSSAKFIKGEPDIELSVDPISGQIEKRKASHSFMTTIDAAILPVLEAFLALCITIGAVSFSMFALSQISIHVLDSDLLVRYQPVTQLFVSPEPRPDFITPDPKATPETDKQKQVADAPSTATATSEIAISTDNALKTDAPSAAEEFPDTPAGMPITEIETPEEIVAADTTLPVTATAPEEEVQLLETPISIQVPPVETIAIEQPMAHPLQNASSAPVETAPIIQAPPPSPETTKRKVATKAEKPVIKTEPEAAETRPKTSVPLKFIQDKGVAALLPGLGIHKLISLGDNLNSHKLGQPIASKVTSNGKQVIFSGLTLLADARTGNVRQITITRNLIVSKIKCQTPQKFAIGSKLNQVRNKMGPSTLIDKLPGLHFPNLGISFIPSAMVPDTIGAIVIYPVGAQPQ